MSEQPSAATTLATSTIPLETASVTDRGLSEKRPHNEDSFLLDAARRIFAVADGVGGAEAGEVASQTAIEVLDEAFRQHQPGDDIEDLLEIAIQRANATIHQQSHGQRGFAMMATTIVALYLDGRRATIGHVGDSRIYRLTPDGRLQRETEDHSVVEEEVRAGRMSPEQAANHPSRNVISRALGAEASVEVDLNTFEVEDGTVFLLCSDGITRHLPDAELGSLLRESPSLDLACAEMKRLCFERGAEDNLTAVCVRVGARAAGGNSMADVDDTERTLISERRDPLIVTTVARDSSAFLRRPLDHTNGGDNANARDAATTTTAATPTGVGTARHVGDEALSRTASATGAADASDKLPMVQHSGNGTGRALSVLLLLAIVGAAAFYGGMMLQRQRAAGDAATVAAPVMPVPTPDPLNGAQRVAQLEGLQRQVDLAPTAEAERMQREAYGQPLQSSDPTLLYLYGRALLLSTKHTPQEALEAFRLANLKIDGQLPAEQDRSLRVQSRVWQVAAAARTNNAEAVRSATQALQGLLDNEVVNGALTTQPQPSPQTQPARP